MAESGLTSHTATIKQYLLTYLLTNSTKQSPSWEANRFSARKKIPRILWNLKVHYHIYKCPSPWPYPEPHWSSPHPPSHFLMIHLNITLPPIRGCSKWPLSHNFSHQNPAYTPTLPHMCYRPHPSPSSRFDQPNNNWWGVQIIKLLIM